VADRCQAVGVAVLLLHPPLLQEPHHQLVISAANKLGVSESEIQ
jgi:hypothetical protein